VAKFKVEDHRKPEFKSSKRDRLEIVSAIIAIAQHPSSTTRLTSQANLSYSLLKEYLKFMIGRHLIEEHETTKDSKKTIVYQATEKGNRFLGIYCDGLILLHGEDFLQNKSNLAGAYLLQYCRKNKLTLGSRLSKSLNAKIENERDLQATRFTDSRKNRS
jgi:predicted transcriptional regulator